jgi:hypothetical protein
MDRAGSTDGEMRNIYNILIRKPARKRDNLEDLGVDGVTLLKMILK